MAKRKRRGQGLGAMTDAGRRCPREGTRVEFSTTPAGRMLYGSYAPPSGARGSVTSIPLGGRRATCMPGPGGGLVYVRWDEHSTCGVSPRDLTKLKKR